MSEASTVERAEDRMEEGQRYLSYRRSVLVRITHWINVVCLAILLMSELQIFKAHPALYWGEASDFDRPIAWIDYEARLNNSGARSA